MHRFDWLEPRSLDEVHAALREHGDDARLMAGGTALMLLMRQGLVQPAVRVHHGTHEADDLVAVLLGPATPDGVDRELVVPRGRIVQ